MGFSSRLKAHRHLLTLETLRFIVEFIDDGNARQAALRSGVPETYAARQGTWLKKLPLVQKALEREYDDQDLKKPRRSLNEIDVQIEVCRDLLGIND